MNIERFNEIVEERITKIRHVLVEKAKEYARPGNRMHNFDEAARLKQESRERAIYGMMIKQYISYLDILDMIDKGELPSRGLIDEKFGDLINYLILTEASIIDKIDSDRRSKLNAISAESQSMGLYDVSKRNKR